MSFSTGLQAAIAVLFIEVLVAQQLLSEHRSDAALRYSRWLERVIRPLTLAFVVIILLRFRDLVA